MLQYLGVSRATHKICTDGDTLPTAHVMICAMLSSPYQHTFVCEGQLENVCNAYEQAAEEGSRHVFAE